MWTPHPRPSSTIAPKVRAYLDMTGAKRGLVVAVTSGPVMPVTRQGDAHRHVVALDVEPGSATVD